MKSLKIFVTALAALPAGLCCSAVSATDAFNCNGNNSFFEFDDTHFSPDFLTGSMNQNG